MFPACRRAWAGRLENSLLYLIFIVIFLTEEIALII